MEKKTGHSFLLEVFIDLLEAFDCIPCVLLIVKFAAYALKRIALTVNCLLLTEKSLTMLPPK